MPVFVKIHFNHHWFPARFDRPSAIQPRSCSAVVKSLPLCLCLLLAACHNEDTAANSTGTFDTPATTATPVPDADASRTAKAEQPIVPLVAPVHAVCVADEDIVWTAQSNVNLL